jgi:predicted nucleotidyltransferase
VRKIEEALRAVVQELRALERSFALLGGFAVSAQTEPRTTKDVDIAVLVANDEDAEQLAYELTQKGYVVRTTVEHLASGRLATIRTVSPNDAIVDLLFASSGVEDVVIADAAVIEVLQGLEIPVASVGHLTAMKVLARDDKHRPQDRVDLHALFKVATDEDLAKATTMLTLIHERGYARGRALEDDLHRALEELR